MISIEFGNKAMITWEGRSCNGKNNEGTSTGITFYGENGSITIESGNAYKIHDLNNNLIKEVKNDRVINTSNLVDPAQELDALHIQNFFDGIKNGKAVISDILSGHKSTLLVQLGNIAQRSGRTLQIDPTNGHIKNDKEAMKYWSREYEKGWEPTI